MLLKCKDRKKGGPQNDLAGLRQPALRMLRLRRMLILLVAMLVECGVAYAQQAPAAPGHPWDSSQAKQPFKAPPRLVSAPNIDPAKIYTLSELVNIAEENNPDTRIAWENAKA